MADVKITFEEVKTKANEIHTCNVNLDQALKDIKTNITSLDAQWTSDASDTIRGKINGMQSKFQTYYEKDTENGMVIQYAYKNVYLNFNFYKDTGKIRVILIDGVKGLDDV